MIATVLLHDGKHGLKTDRTPAEAAAEARPERPTWIDIEAPGLGDRELLSVVLGLHPTVVELALNPGSHRPHVERADDYVSIFLQGIDWITTSDTVTTTGLLIVVTHDVVVSIHHTSLFSLASVRDAVKADPGLLGQGPMRLAVALADGLTVNFGPAIDQIRDVADDLEEALVSKPGREHMDLLLRLKRSSARLDRVLPAQAHAFASLLEGDDERLDEDARILLRDIRRRAEHLQGRVASLRERIDSSLSLYLSALSIRQNEVMKSLAIIAGIFLPLSLLAGIYGMNFEEMPELGWNGAYYVVVGLIVTVALMGLGWVFVERWTSTTRAVARRAVRTLAVDPSTLVNYTERASTWGRSRVPTAAPRRAAQRVVEATRAGGTAAPAAASQVPKRIVNGIRRFLR